MQTDADDIEVALSAIPVDLRILPNTNGERKDLFGPFFERVRRTGTTAMRERIAALLPALRLRFASITVYVRLLNIHLQYYMPEERDDNAIYVFAADQRSGLEVLFALVDEHLKSTNEQSDDGDVLKSVHTVLRRLDGTLEDARDAYDLPDLHDELAYMEKVDISQ